MHILTGIIVPIDGTELDDEIRNKAEWTLECYEGTVWDWYDIRGGRWINEFENENNVIRASENNFFEFVNRLRNNQKNEFDYFLNQLPSNNIDDFLKYYEIKSTTDLATYYLQKFAELLNGDFISCSYIYDSEIGSSKITEERVKDYGTDRNHYAIVMVDIHY